MLLFLAPEAARALFNLTDVARRGRGYTVAVVIVLKIDEVVTKVIGG